jgi:hypothetical protein
VEKVTGKPLNRGREANLLRERLISDTVEREREAVLR